MAKPSWIAALVVATLSVPAQATPLDCGPIAVPATQPMRVAAANIDGSLGADVVTATSSYQITVHLATASGSLGPGILLPSGPISVLEVVAADLTGDGRDEVIARTFSGVAVFVNRGFGSFDPPAEYALPRVASSLTVGDVDGVSGRDVIVALTGAPPVVLPNQGDGRLGSPISSVDGDGLAMVHAGDVDQDGRADVVGASGREVSVLRGTGSGQLVQIQSWPVPSRPASVRARDLDGDGRVEAIASLASPGRFFIAPNTGGGSFGPPVTLDAPGLWRPFEVADFDGDGLADLAYEDELDGARVLRHLGGLTFVAGASAWDAFDTYDAFAVADIDAMNGPDIVTGQMFVSRLLIHRNDGSGRFQGPPPPEWQDVGDPLGSLAVADLDGTLGADVVIGREGVFRYLGSRDVGILRHSPLAGWEPLESLGSVSPPVDLVTADMNGDGVGDLVEALSDPSQVIVALGDGAGGFAPLPTVMAGQRIVRLQAGDVDADGRVDVVALDGDGAAVLTLRNMGGGVLALAASRMTRTAPSSIALGAFDPTPGLDVAIGHVDARNIDVFIGDGTGSFPGWVETLTTGAYPELARIDLDHVPPEDLVGIADNPDPAITSRSGRVLPNAGDGTFTEGAVFGASTSLLVDDLDRDGWEDVAGTVSIVGSTDFGRLYIQRNVSGTLQGLGGPTMAAYGLGRMVAGDFVPGDWRDIAVTSAWVAEVHVMRGLGTGVYISTPTVATGGVPLAIVATDADADSDADLLTLNETLGDISRIDADGAGGFAAPVSLLSCDDGKIAAVADLDGAAALDIVAANGRCQDVRAWIASGPRAYGPALRAPLGAEPIALAIGDVGGGPEDDVVTLTTRGPSGAPIKELRTLIADGSGGLGAPVITPACDSAARLVLADVDGGGLDAVLTCGAESFVDVMSGTGAGGFGSPARHSAVASEILLPDLNDDGLVDLVTTRATSVSVQLATGPGSFGTPVSLGLASFLGALDAVDWDADGDLDLAVAGGIWRGLRIFINDGAGAFPQSVDVAFGEEPYFLGHGDFDGDGADEIVTGDGPYGASRLGSRVAILPECLPVTPVLMRDDTVTALMPLTPTRAAIIAGFSLLGPDGVATPGEGADPTLPGSDDDDRAYIESPALTLVDPDPRVASDPARPLVFYALNLPRALLRVRKAGGGGLELTWTP